MQDTENRRICGYMLLRAPGNELLTGECGVLERPSDGRKIYYHGMDRNPWYDFDNAYFEQTLSPALADLWNKKNDMILAQCWPETLCDFSEVVSVQRHFAERESVNEIIGIYTATLDQTQGSFPCETGIEWLGYDLVPYGEFSLILAGIFQFPNPFETCYELLNEYGLFDNKAAADTYATRYRSLMEEGLCNEFAMSLEYVRIGRVNIPVSA